MVNWIAVVATNADAYVAASCGVPTNKADLMTFPTDLMRENPSHQLHLSFLMVLDDEKVRSGL